MPKEVKWAISFLAGLALVVLGWKFHAFLVTFHILLCLVLILVVLIQSGKAADLAGAFGGMGSQTAFGPRGAANFLTRATTWCAVMFMLTTMSMVLTQTRVSTPAGSSVLDEAPATTPATPAQAPAQQTPPPAGQTPPPAQQQPTPEQQAPPPSTPQNPPAKKP
jgi:preprotein translocase subunit SecG